MKKTIIKNNFIYEVISKQYYKSNNYIKIYSIKKIKKGKIIILYDKIIEIKNNKKTINITIY